MQYKDRNETNGADAKACQTNKRHIFSDERIEENEGRTKPPKGAWRVSRDREAHCQKNFERVNRRDFDALLKDRVPSIYHRFGGKHALSGERHDREALGRWLGRLARLATNLHLTVTDVWVKGLPQNTTIIVRWTATDDVPDGSAYHNHGVHIIKMRWGKIIAIDANEDSQAVAESLQMRAAHGVEEASAPPIVS